jgi:DNA-binding response OmpR family regulator
VGSEAVREKALTLYDEEYITKPVEFADLKIKIDEVLKRKRL